MKHTAFILHGWAYDIAKWHPLIEELQNDGISVQMLNIPGLTTEPLTKAWDINDYVSWLKKEIGNTPAILIGHSNGGRISLNFAKKYPDLVKQLILIDSAGIPRRELKARVKRSVLKMAAKTGKVFTRSDRVRRLLYKLGRADDYYKAQPVMRETMANLLQSDYDLDATKVVVPTQLIWGKNDTATPVKDAHALKSQIKDAQLKIIDDARHSPQFTHMPIVAKAIKEFVHGDL